jgi:hypothetical protein
MNGILKTDWTTIGDAILTGVVAAVLVALVGIITTPGFDVLATNWLTVGHQMLNLGLVSAATILGKDLLSTNSGSLLGIGATN